jgi:hypothetical protein
VANQCLCRSDPLRAVLALSLITRLKVGPIRPARSGGSRSVSSNLLNLRDMPRRRCDSRVPMASGDGRRWSTPLYREAGTRADEVPRETLNDLPGPACADEKRRSSRVAGLIDSLELR